MTSIDNRFYPIQASTRQVTAMRERFDKLQLQLATGERAGSLAELGSDRFFDLTIRARSSRIAGYQANLTTLNLRLGMLGATLSRLGTVQSDARAIMRVSDYGRDDINLGTAPKEAQARLDEVLSLLNAEVGGRYMFGGTKTDSKPVASLAAVLDGEGGRAGFRTVLGERRLADLGADGLGRLIIERTGATVTLAEDGIHGFGFKLGAVSTSGAALTAAQPASDPASLGIALSAQPQRGERISIGLTLPDGSETVVTLVAGGDRAGGFALGGDVAATAANLEAALRAALIGVGNSALAAASAFAAAENFFNAQGEPVRRVDGPPFETATGVIDADVGTSVAWYRGDDSGTPRGAVSARIDDGVSVGYGSQANEAGPLALVRSLAVMATADFPAGDDAARQRFDAIAIRQISQLGQRGGADSVDAMAVEIGLAQARVDGVSEHHTRHAEQLKILREGIEGIPTEEVAMEILALRTRLQASFETASLVSQLSLVNYMR